MEDERMEGDTVRDFWDIPRDINFNTRREGHGITDSWGVMRLPPNGEYQISRIVGENMEADIYRVPKFIAEMLDRQYKAGRLDQMNEIRKALGLPPEN
jgi:hypothetical protein